MTAQPNSTAMRPSSTGSLKYGKPSPAPNSPRPPRRAAAALPASSAGRGLDRGAGTSPTVGKVARLGPDPGPTDQAAGLEMGPQPAGNSKADDARSPPLGRRLE